MMNQRITDRVLSLSPIHLHLRVNIVLYKNTQEKVSKNSNEDILKSHPFPLHITPSFGVVFLV